MPSMWFLRLIISLPRFCIWMFVFALQMIIFASDKIVWIMLGRYEKTKYVRQGACKKSGICCKTIGIGYPRLWLKSPIIVRLINRYMAYVHNFHSRDFQVDGLLIFECHYLTPENTCSIRPFRPTICREFPYATLTGRSKLYQNCGYWFIEREKLGTFEEKIIASKHRKNC